MNPNTLFYVYCVVIIAVCFSGKYTVVGILSAAAAAHIFVSGRGSAGSMMPVFPALIILLLCATLTWIKKTGFRQEIDRVREDIQKQDSRLDQLTGKTKVLRAKNRSIEKKLNEIVTIYEYVKQLGATLEFEDAVKILEAALRKLVAFKSGKVMLLSEKNVSRIYEVYGSDLSGENRCFPPTRATRALREYEKTAAEKILSNPVIQIYAKDKPSGISLPNGTETLIFLPLSCEQHTVGILMLENMPLGDIDKIRFPALQFAMEIKKTDLYQRVKELSIFDGLTRLYLRRHFMELFTNELDRAGRLNHPVSFIMTDVDFFKRYNDEYGHLAGDLILQKIAGLYKDKSREMDLLCRYGGDEFALLLPRTAPKDAVMVAERLRSAVNSAPFTIAGEAVPVSVSMGIVSYLPKDPPLMGINSVIIDAADKALYQAKAQGRNRVVAVSL